MSRLILLVRHSGKSGLTLDSSSNEALATPGAGAGAGTWAGTGAETVSSSVLGAVVMALESTSPLPVVSGAGASPNSLPVPVEGVVVPEVFAPSGTGGLYARTEPPFATTSSTGAIMLLVSTLPLREAGAGGAAFYLKIKRGVRTGRRKRERGTKARRALFIFSSLRVIIASRHNITDVRLLSHLEIVIEPVLHSAACRARHALRRLERVYGVGGARSARHEAGDR